MKFYEVQPALEAGKQIKRSSGYDNVLGISLSKCKHTNKLYVEVFNDGSEAIWEISSHDLRADDWEIVDDIPEIKLFRSKQLLYICPECERISEKIVHSEDKPETIHECPYCGQKFRFWNLEEMKNIK